MRKYSTIFTALFMGSATYIPSSQALVIYYDDSRAGEASMARGITKAFEQQAHEAPEVYTFSQKTAFEKRLSGEKDALLLVG